MNNNYIFWVVVVVVAFPLAMLALGEINVNLRRRDSNLSRPLESLRNLVLPTLTFYILLSKIIGLGPDAISVRLAETLMWISLIYTALNFLNLFLFEGAKEGTWQANVPKIFLDTSRFFLILIGSAIVLSRVWGADLGGLITALGVGSLVIGLALQDSLGNIFSGVALLFERPFKLGEWIEVGDKVGKVQEITWRSVHLVTRSGDLIIVPNSELAKGGIYNYSRPTPTCRINLELGFSYDDPPNKVKRVLTETALATEGVLSAPAPIVATAGYGDFTINYRILLFISDFSNEPAVKEGFLTRVWYSTKRNGLTMPYPIAAEMEYQPSVITEEQRSNMAKKALRSVSAINQFDEDMLDLVARRGIWLDYARDEIILHEGQQLQGMYLVVQGRGQLRVTNAEGNQQTLVQIKEGDFFGEKSSLMTEQKSDVTALALEDLTLILLDKDTIGLMLEHSPRLSNELGEVMEFRRRAIQSLQK